MQTLHCRSHALGGAAAGTGAVIGKGSSLARKTIIVWHMGISCNREGKQSQGINSCDQSTAGSEDHADRCTTRWLPMTAPFSLDFVQTSCLHHLLLEDGCLHCGIICEFQTFSKASWVFRQRNSQEHSGHCQDRLNNNLLSYIMYEYHIMY